MPPKSTAKCIICRKPGGALCTQHSLMWLSTVDFAEADTKGQLVGALVTWIDRMLRANQPGAQA